MVFTSVVGRGPEKNAAEAADVNALPYDGSMRATGPSTFKNALPEK